MRSPHFFLFVTVVALALGIFVIDLLAPLGVAVWLPYVLVVLLSLWLPHRRSAYLTAAGCTVLTTIGLFKSSPGIEFWMALVNRVLAVAAFWLTAFFGLAARRTLELEKANADLQREMERRRKLESQLLRTQRLESIGILAGGIAHDFNNILTPVLMGVKLLKEDRTEEDRQHLLKTLQAGVERGAEMVRQLLSFAGGVDGEMVAVQPMVIIQEVLGILDHTFPKTIQIRVEADAETRPVRVDVTQLSQVLMNLCVNARDAMPEGGSLTIQVRNAHLDEAYVRMHPDARIGSFLRMTVQDTGTGISPDVIDKVFDPFFTTKSPGKGTGLGLSTTLGIVRAHGGFIHVTSDVGKGSLFSVYLPVCSSTTCQTGKDRSEVSEGQGELVLVVDDEPVILETVRTTLESRGYRVLTAPEGETAVALFREEMAEIDAVLLDMMMPGMGGGATILALHELDPRVRIIASSGLRPAGPTAQTIAVSKCLFLPKPYSDVQLLRALQQVLRSREGKQ